MSYIPIASQTLGSATASVSFSSLPQIYRDLVVIINARSDSGSITTVIDIAFNNNTTSGNYQYALFQGNGSSTGGDSSSGRSVAISADIGNALSIINIMDYTQNKNKIYLSRSDNAEVFTRFLNGRWLNNSAITSVTFTNSGGWNFRAGSTFELYGLLG